MKITKLIIVHGCVQGVGFRESLRREAQRVGVTGWVRNRHDGTVEAIVQGSPQEVGRVLEWMRHGPPSARVTHMHVDEAAGEFDAFEQRPSG